VAPDDSDVFGALVLLAAGVFGAVLVVVWAGAVLAIATTGGGLVRPPIDDVVLAARLLPTTLGDPRAAWPQPWRSGLPGPGAYWAATAAIAAAILAVGLSAAVKWPRRRWGLERRRRLGVDTQARFATRRRQMAALLVGRAEPGRFILGRSVPGGHLLATENRSGAAARRGPGSSRRADRGAVALIGPSRCGKTTAVISGVLEWDGPAVLSSVKNDLLEATRRWRSSIGEVRVYDPTGCTGAAAAGWSPLRDARTTFGAQRAARVLVDAAPRTGREGGDDFWLAQAEILLSGLLWVAAITPGMAMGDVVEWVLTQDRPTEETPGVVRVLLEALLRSGDEAIVPHAEAATKALLAVWQLEDRTRSSVYATAQTVVWPWADPGVAESARTCDIDLDWLLTEANTAYLCAPLEDQRRLAPAFGGLLNDILKQAFARVAATGRPLDPQLLVVLDEAGNTPLRSLPELASTVAGLGILLVTVWQSRAQIDATYREQAESILTNHLSKLFYASMSDLGGLDTVARLLGQEQAATLQRSTDTGLGSRRGSVTQAGTEVQLAPAHVVRQMRPGDAVLVHGTLPPIHVRTRPWYAERSLRARAAGAVPPSRGRRGRRSRRG
jgi:type IV secretion system protein VirD4